jgi:DNA-binding NarL/FixJ family response regulator
MREAILSAIAGHPDIEVVRDVENDSEIDKVVEETDPDVLIVGLELSDRLPDVCYSILEKHPFLKVIGIASGRDSTILYWARIIIHSERIETSEEGLLKALQRMA